ncbi:hypothetical protein [Streptococcus mutans]|uniref:hypothetical protein n=1 Tax=Streptococcus mutans TaxID=1309 RepID=UPI0014557EFE|nr:hypothetical protein [Streptococcus mutans]
MNTVTLDSMAFDYFETAGEVTLLESKEKEFLAPLPMDFVKELWVVFLALELASEQALHWRKFLLLWQQKQPLG